MNTVFTRFTEGFKEWLGILGYEAGTVKSLPRTINHFFEYMQAGEINTLEEITPEQIQSWYESQKQRKSKLTGELLKGSTLNGINRTIRLFSHYLEETNQGVLTVDVPYEPKEIPEREILTREEVKAFYHAADESILGLRDRAILSIYYGCGLRSKEGIFLTTGDILMDKKLLYVRKGKQYRERYVPFVESQATDFKLYLKECRPHLLQEYAEPWFLLNNKGGQASSHFLIERVKQLAEISGILKNVGLHTFRHSIATHLLQSGMRIESISQFLGHKNIDSTQRYTHILGKDEGL